MAQMVDVISVMGLRMMLFFVGDGLGGFLVM